MRRGAALAILIMLPALSAAGATGPTYHPFSTDHGWQQESGEVRVEGGALVVSSVASSPGVAVSPPVSGTWVAVDLAVDLDFAFSKIEARAADGTTIVRAHVASGDLFASTGVDDEGDELPSERLGRFRADEISRLEWYLDGETYLIRHDGATHGPFATHQAAPLTDLRVLTLGSGQGPNTVTVDQVLLAPQAPQASVSFREGLGPLRPAGLVATVHDSGALTDSSLRIDPALAGRSVAYVEAAREGPSFVELHFAAEDAMRQPTATVLGAGLTGWTLDLEGAGPLATLVLDDGSGETELASWLFDDDYHRLAIWDHGTSLTVSLDDQVLGTFQVSDGASTYRIGITDAGSLVNYPVLPTSGALKVDDVLILEL